MAVDGNIGTGADDVASAVVDDNDGVESGTWGLMGQSNDGAELGANDGGVEGRFDELSMIGRSPLKIVESQ